MECRSGYQCADQDRPPVVPWTPLATTQRFGARSPRTFRAGGDGSKIEVKDAHGAQPPCWLRHQRNRLGDARWCLGRSSCRCSFPMMLGPRRLFCINHSRGCEWCGRISRTCGSRDLQRRCRDAIGTWPRPDNEHPPPHWEAGTRHRRGQFGSNRPGSSFGNQPQFRQDRHKQCDCSSNNDADRSFRDETLGGQWLAQDDPV